MSESVKTQIISISMSALVSALVAIGAIAFLSSNSDESATNQSAAALESVTDEQRSFASGSVVDIVAEASPSVVSVAVSRDVPQYRTSVEPGPFGLYFQNRQQDGVTRQQVGSGSGFFVSDDLLVTNRHVVSQMDATYEAITSDGERIALELVGRDPFLDVAILRTDESAPDFRPLKFGNSDDLQVGQEVIAIGNALGEFQNSVSTGVISGLSRSIIAGTPAQSERLEQVIQTDAAINPGNSGGPLLNRAGEVVGVNVAIAEGSDNISFALPANAVAEVVESVRETGEIVRPFLGVRYMTLTPEIAASESLETEIGAWVVAYRSTPAVTQGSAADEAGIQEGDIITAIAGQPISESTSIGQLIRSYSVGETVPITIVRGGFKRELSVTLQPAPDTFLE